MFSLLLAACASAPPPATPAFASVPSAIVESMCARLHDEGMNGDVFAVKTTRPLITPAVLQALAEAAFYRGQADDRGAREAASAPPIPLDLPAKSCVRRFVDAPDSNADVMLLEFSRPFPNPFARGQLGLVVRLSLGGEAAIWYWLPLGHRGGGWVAGAPSMLALRE
jgi:hypothetical protein